MTDSPYVAKRVQAGVPIWSIFAHGQDIGTLTNLPMESSPMVTVRYNGMEVTFAEETVCLVLGLAGDWLRDIDGWLEMQADEDAAIHEMEYFAEVIGPMQAAEAAAERAGWGRDEDPVW